MSTSAATTVPGLGHNRPPLPTPKEVRADLDQAHAALVARRDEILAGAKRFGDRYPNGIPDETVLAKATDFVGQKGAVANYLAAVDAMHTTEKRPWLEGGRVVDAFKNGLASPVEEARKTLRAAMLVFSNKREEQRRAAAEEAARRAAEAAALAEAEALASMDPDALERAAAAAEAAETAQAQMGASTADLTRSHGELGTVSSVRKRWVFKEEDSNLMKLVRAVAKGEAPLAYLQFNGVAIRRAITSDGVRMIPGCVIEEERGVV